MTALRRVRHVVLIGLSGSGKTTVGRLLAERLRRPFVDTDALIEASAGETIPHIFETRGEPAFRDLEHAAVQQAVAAAPSVIATGGGAPVPERNRLLLWESNLVVWLDAPPEVLVERVGAHGAGRPLLASDGGAGARLAQLHAQRAPVYALAHARIATHGQAPDQVAEQIARTLEEQTR